MGAGHGLMQEQRAPQHAEHRHQEGHAERAQRPDVGDEAEVQHVGCGGAQQAQRQQRGPHTRAAPAGGWLDCDRGREHRGQQQRGAQLAAQRHQPCVQAAALGDPAAGEEAGQAVTPGGHQAGQCTGRQRPGKSRGTRGGQRGHAAQAQAHARQLAAGDGLTKEQCADGNAHQRGGCIEDGRIARRQPLRGQAVHRKREAGIDDAQRHRVFQLALEAPTRAHQRQDGAQAQQAEQDTEEGRGPRAQHRRRDLHEQEAGTPQRGQQAQAEIVGNSHGPGGIVMGHYRSAAPCATS